MSDIKTLNGYSLADVKAREDIDILKDNAEILPVEVSTSAGGIDYRTGLVVTAGWANYRFGKVEINNLGTIHMHDYTTSTTVNNAGWAFWDEYGNPILTGQYAGATLTELDVEIPVNAKQFVFTIYGSVNPVVIIKKTAPLVFDTYAYNHLIYSKVICCGDSLTYGDGAVNGKEDYPTRLAQMTGWEVTNAGKNGATLASWMTDKYPSYNFAQYDACIIDLMTNNGSTAYDDLVSGYEAIVNAIKGQNGNLDIYLVVNNTWVEGTGIGRNSNRVNALYAVAEETGCKVIDLINVVENLQADKYHLNPSNVHMNKYGYLAKARAILRIMNGLIADI